MFQLGLSKDLIRQQVLDLIRRFVEVELRRAYEAAWHRSLITWTSYNVRAFSNENLAELAGVVGEEVSRRNAAAPPA